MESSSPPPSIPAALASGDSTVVSPYTPDEYERTYYYNGIASGGNPELLYRSDFLTRPFPKPVGRFAYIPEKSVRGVFRTPLNAVWDTVGPQVRDILKARNIRWTTLNPARFFIYDGPSGETEQGTLGPVVIWISVGPGSTSSETAHEASQEILGLLQKNGVNDVVVEWYEGEVQRL